MEQIHLHGNDPCFPSGDRPDNGRFGSHVERHPGDVLIARGGGDSGSRQGLERMGGHDASSSGPYSDVRAACNVLNLFYLNRTMPLSANGDLGVMAKRLQGALKECARVEGMHVYMHASRFFIEPNGWK